MTPTHLAKQNLTDYEARIINRVIDPNEATHFLPAGTQQWKAEIWHRGDDKLVGDGSWEATLKWAWVDAEKMFGNLLDALVAKAEKEAELGDVA